MINAGEIFVFEKEKNFTNFSKKYHKILACGHGPRYSAFVSEKDHNIFMRFCA
jgi:hypothetical protein